MSQIDLTRIQSLVNLEQKSGQDLLRTLAEIYFTQASTIVEVLRAAIAKKDTTLLKRESHSFKSSSASLGAMEIQEICAAIEEEVTLNFDHYDLEKVQSLISEMDGKLDSTIDELARIIELKAG